MPGVGKNLPILLLIVGLLLTGLREFSLFLLFAMDLLKRSVRGTPEFEKHFLRIG